MAPSGPAYHTDWVWSGNSNVHVANHRDWFSTFTDFRSSMGTIYFSGHETEVLGVGDVELNVQTASGRPNRVVLREVLYAPTGRCNILGQPILADYGLTTGGKGSGLTDQRTGASAGLIDPVNLVDRLRLVGMSATESCLARNELFIINVCWSDKERARYREARAQTQIDAQAPTTLPPLTEEQRRWLKEHYDSEWNFLQTYGLKLTKEDQRAEGRAILKALMEED